MHSPPKCQVTLTKLSATKDTVLPLSTSIVGADGTVMDEIPIPKGCEVIIGILGANTSKDIWGEDSLEWRPERWLDPLPSSVAQNTLSGVSPNLCVSLVLRSYVVWADTISSLVACHSVEESGPACMP